MVQSDVLQTSEQHLLFSNSISTGLKGNVGSSGLAYAMPFPVMVWHGTKDVLCSFSATDIMPVCLGNILTLFLEISGIEICCICDTAQVWGGPRAMEHTKNASYRGGQAAN